MKFAKLFLGLSLFACLAQAEDRVAGAPEQVIRDFYQWYVGALMKNRDPSTQDRTQLKRFATDRLLREIDHMRKGPDGLDGDYFVDAQDFDKDWGKNIEVSKTSIDADRATTVVELKGREMGKRKLHVRLLREKGTWKVDKVEGQH